MANENVQDHIAEDTETPKGPMNPGATPTRPPEVTPVTEEKDERLVVTSPPPEAPTASSSPTQSQNNCAQVLKSPDHLELGMTYITRDQQVVTIVAHCRRLQADKSITEVWEGDNQVNYQTNGKVDDNLQSPSDLILQLGSDINSLQIATGLDHAKKAEEILNDFCLEVIVRPAPNANSSTQE